MALLYPISKSNILIHKDDAISHGDMKLLRVKFIHVDKIQNKIVILKSDLTTLELFDYYTNISRHLRTITYMEYTCLASFKSIIYLGTEHGDFVMIDQNEKEQIIKVCKGRIASISVSIYGTFIAYSNCIVVLDDEQEQSFFTCVSHTIVKIEEYQGCMYISSTDKKETSFFMYRIDIANKQRIIELHEIGTELKDKDMKFIDTYTTYIRTETESIYYPEFTRYFVHVKHCSPVSCILEWTPLDIPDITYSVRNMRTNTLIKAKMKETNIYIQNLEPCNDYEFRVETNFGYLGHAICSITTLEGTMSHFQMEYDFLKENGNIFITSSEMKKKLHSLGQSGDELNISTTINGRVVHARAQLAKKQDYIQFSEKAKNIYLPFIADEADQTVTIDNGNGACNIEYHNDDCIFIDGTKHKIGDLVYIGNKRAYLSKGSLILMFEDSTPHIFNNPGLENDIIESDKYITGNTIASTKMTVVSAGSVSTNLTYSSSLQELSSMNYDSGVELGLAKVTWTSGNDSQKVIDLDSKNVNVSAYTSNDVRLTTHFDASGISFDSDDACIYFGSDKQFRLKYFSGTSDKKARLSFQYNTQGVYVTKTEFSKY